MLAAEFAWRNDPITLYHGTRRRHVESVLSGIDLRVCAAKTDFGRGFYTTTSLGQAQEWAEILSQRAVHDGWLDPDDEPAVVSFAVKLEILAKLDSISFVRADPDAQHYWSLVMHCRSGGGHERPHFGWYDVVSGPVAQDTTKFRDREIIAGYDQVSFHTEAAVSILDGCPKQEEPWDR